MGAFQEELYKYLNPELVSAMGGFKVMLYDTAIAVIEGHRGLKTLSVEKVVFKLKKGLVEITGKGLSIAALSKGHAVIRGMIKNIEIK